jgi:hypothetical protein
MLADDGVTITGAPVTVAVAVATDVDETDAEQDASKTSATKERISRTGRHSCMLVD